MAKIFIEESSLIAICDAIRAKTGSTEKLTVPDGIIAAINSLGTGGSGDSDEHTHEWGASYADSNYPSGYAKQCTECGVIVDATVKEFISLSINEGETYSDNLYHEFDKYNLTPSKLQIVVVDPTIVSCVCEEPDEPYLYITGLKNGSTRVELPQLGYVYDVTVVASSGGGSDDDNTDTTTYDFDIGEGDSFNIPIPASDVVVDGCPSFLTYTISHEDGYIVFTAVPDKEGTGTIVLSSRTLMEEKRYKVRLTR